MGPRAAVSRRQAGVLLLGGLLAGCGFRPLYGDRGGPDGSVQDRLGEVTVLLIPERYGQILRQALQTRFERNGPGSARRYDLSVYYGLSGEGIAIQQDTAPTRIRLVANASWSLLAQDPQRRTLASGNVRQIDGYDLINQQFFAGELSSDAVQRRMAEALAEQITAQVAAYFSQQQAAR